MLTLLLLMLCIGAIMSFLISHKNILSASFIAHVAYLLAVLIIIWNYDSLRYDFSIETIFVIIVSLMSVALGEMLIRDVFVRKYKHFYYPSEIEIQPIRIGSSLFIISILGISLLSIYNYYSFNIKGTYLGGYDFASKYVLLRTATVSEQQGRETDMIGVPFGLPMAYFGFFIEIVVYFFVFLFLYNRTFKIHTTDRKNIWNLLPFILYLPTCLLGTTRSVFIKLLTVFALIYFILLNQKVRGWNNKKGVAKILKGGVCVLLLFAIIFGTVGQLKDQDVSGALKETVCAYAGAPVIGFDLYMKGKIEKESDYFGQETLRHFYMAINKLGFDYEIRPYHQEEFSWGKHGESSNIFSSPFYLLVDYPLIVVMFIYVLFGAIVSFFLNAIKYGMFKIRDFEGYLLCAIFYHAIIMMPITEQFHHTLGTVFLYSLISMYIVKRIYVKKIKMR